MDSIRDWTTAGQLDRHIHKKAMHHSEDSVNAFLARAANCPEAILTFDDFESEHPVKLLETSQAARLLNVPVETLAGRARSKLLPALRIGGTWRFALIVLKARIAQAKTQFTLDDIEKVLGCGVTHIRDLKDKGWITPLPNSNPVTNPRMHVYSEANIIAAVERMLPEQHKSRAAEWVASTLASKQSPLSSGDAMHQLGCTSTKEVRELIRATNTLYLQLKGDEWGHWRFRPADIFKLFMQQRPLSFTELARYVACTPGQAHDWFSGTCRLHDHQTGLEYRHACFINVIRSWIPAHTAIGEWLPGPYFLLESTANKLQVSLPDVVLAIRIGLLKALRRPDGVIIIAANTVNNTNKATLLKKLAPHRNGA